jgi:ATP-grasp domain, R2K clade family 3
VIFTDKIVVDEIEITMIILPCEPFSPRHPDPVYASEFEAWKKLGQSIALLDHDLLEHEGKVSILIPPNIPAPMSCAYRGWMLQCVNYEQLYEVLIKKGLFLMNTPEQYRACHHYPDGWYAMKKWLPQSSWITIEELDDSDLLKLTMRLLDSSSAVVKDWVKSEAKGHWLDACYIDDVSNLALVRKICCRFIELRGKFLTGGLVFRSYIPLKDEEWRIFSIDGIAVATWCREKHETLGPPLELVQEICQALPGRFATADIALTRNDQWQLIEIGDGGVSSLPNGVDPMVLLRTLASSLNQPRVKTDKAYQT